MHNGKQVKPSPLSLTTLFPPLRTTSPSLSPDRVDSVPPPEVVDSAAAEDPSGAFFLREGLTGGGLSKQANYTYIHTYIHT